MLSITQDIRKEIYPSTYAVLLFIVLLKITVTLLTVYVYTKFSSFPDAERYLNANLGSWSFSYLFNRTLFTDFIFAFLKNFLIFNIAVHLFVSISLGGILWYVFKDDYRCVNKPLLYGCIFLPHFLIWSGMVGKEALAIAGFLLFIKASIDLVVWNKFRVIPLFLGLFLGFIIRPHYAVVYVYLFIISLLVGKSRVQLMGLFSPHRSLFLLGVVLGYLGLLYTLLHPLFSDSLLQFMRVTRRYFFIFTQNNSNRGWILWKDTSDFFSNIPWGIPTSIIGPTYTEAWAKPIFWPVLIEGYIALILLIICSYKLLRFTTKFRTYSSIIIWGFLPALLLGLLINYPFGLFNPGSAIRYKQSLSPLIYFYPLLLMAAAQRKAYIEQGTACN